MTEYEKSYVAGIVDGEGNISLLKSKNKSCTLGYAIAPTIQIAGTDLLFMTDICNLTNGKIHICKNNCINKHRNKIVIYFKGRKSVIKLLEEIYPYLRLKNKQAEIVLNYCKRRESMSNKSPYSNKYITDQEIMKLLNKRGVISHS